MKNKNAPTEAKARNKSNAANYIKSTAKHITVTLAMWRVIPVSLAEWLIQAGGLQDA